MTRMSQKAALTVVGTGSVVVGLLAGTGAAHAAPPGDLQVSSAVVCQDGYTVRAVAVKNVGGSAITGVRVGSLGGSEISRFPAVKANKPELFHGITIASSTGVRAEGALAAGESIAFGDRRKGCDGEPYVIVGYAIGDQVDNVFSAPNYHVNWALAGPTAPVISALADR